MYCENANDLVFSVHILYYTCTFQHSEKIWEEFKILYREAMLDLI